MTLCCAKKGTKKAHGDHYFLKRQTKVDSCNFLLVSNVHGTILKSLVGQAENLHCGVTGLRGSDAYIRSL